MFYFMHKLFCNSGKRNVDPTGHWDLVGKLGDGAFGDVFKAKNKVSQEYAAAKIIELTSEDDIEEHATEIDILAKCQHKNIVKLVDSMLNDRKLWILIEFCEGGALDDIIEKVTFFKILTPLRKLGHCDHL